MALTASPLAAQVEFLKGTDQVEIRVNGKPFSVLHYGRAENKPFLHPLLTPSGKNVLRGFPVAPLAGEPTDRPHQRGVWVGSESVTGPSGRSDFWENDPLYPTEGKGKIVVQKLLEATHGPDGRLSFETRWIGAQGETLVVEHRTLIIYSQPADCRMFDVEIQLEAAAAITFDDEQDAIFGMRLALPFDDHYDGKIVSEKGRTQEDVRGHRAAWIDWTAELDPRQYRNSIAGNGEKIGVAIFDHPSNHNYPSRWQVRSSGVFFISPFGGTAFQKFDPAATSAALSLPRGAKQRFRYRVLIHPGDVSVQPFFAAWAKQK